MKNFSLKFIDIMVGMVLGLGFQWWPVLQQPWQYVAFVFAYLDIVDNWIDYSPSLKKFPPKREVDVMLDVGIMFSLFLYIYTTQLTLTYFLGAFILFKVLDFFWLLSSRAEFHPTGVDKVFVDTWLKINVIEAALSLVLIFVSWSYSSAPLTILFAYIVARVALRVLASTRYKKVHFT